MADIQVQGLPLYASFNSGELTPLLWDRVKFERYAPGAMLLNNFIVTKHGPIFRRPGTLYVAQAKQTELDFDNDKKRLKKFIFNRTQVYMLEFGHKYIRFYTYDDAGNPLLVEDEGEVYEVTTPYTADDLPELRFTQSMDTIYITHSLYAPRTLVRKSSTDWTLAIYETEDGPYELENLDSNFKMTPSAASGTNVTVTASKDVFTENMVGRLLRIEQSKKPGYAKIVSFTDATHVKVDIKHNFKDTSATDSWRFGAWYGAEGDPATAHYPNAVSFHMERLYFGGGLYTPQTIWGSRPGDFPNFSPTDEDDELTDDMGVSFTLATDELNSIVWLKSTDSLYIGTIGPEFRLTTSSDEVITPTNFQFVRISNYGSSRLEPQFIGNSIVFSQNSLRVLRELAYQYSSDSFLANDITILGEHLTAPGITSYNYQQEPHSIIWCTQQTRRGFTSSGAEDTGGLLLGLTYDKEQNVMAWHRHTIGGNEVEVENVECVFNDTIQQDQVWICCRRKLNNQLVRTLEIIDKDFRMETPLEEMYFVDCGAKYNAYALPESDPNYGQPVSYLTGLNWLANEQVQVTVDGATHTDVIVDENGRIDLETPGKFITVGFYSPAQYQSLYLDPGAGGDTFAQGHQQNVVKAKVRFYRTMGGRMGATLDKMLQIQYRTPQNAMDEAIPLFTGEKELLFQANWNDFSQVCIEQDVPLPMTILAVIPIVNVVR